MIALLLLLSTVAQPAEQTPEDSPDKRSDLARSYYEKGLVRFNLADYDGAVEIFKEGYAKTGAAGFLFDIAQAYRLSGDCASALNFYRSYLRANPDSRSRDRIESRMEEMKACAKPKETATSTGALSPEPNVVAIPLPEPPPESSAGRTRIVGTVLFALGFAGVGAGVYFQAQATSAADKITALSRAGGEWTPADEAIQTRGQRMSTASIIAYAVGAAAAIAGTALHVSALIDGVTRAPEDAR
jgi:tetratricopeptide (TPR) repeat protein